MNLKRRDETLVNRYSSLRRPLVTPISDEARDGWFRPELTPVIDELLVGQRQGLHVGAQLYVRLEGDVVCDVATGLASPNATMRTDSIMRWFCATKPYVAYAIVRLHQQGVIDLDDEVARYVPEYASFDKAHVTIRDLLCHNIAYERDLGLPILKRQQNNEADIACDLPLRGPIGSCVAYSRRASWVVLAEVLHRITRVPGIDWVHNTVFLPLDMGRSWIGNDEARADQFRDSVGVTFMTSGPQPTPALWMDHRSLRGWSCPAMGGRGPARELARLFERIDDVYARRVSADEDLAIFDAMTATNRCGKLEHTYGASTNPIDLKWGLGAVVDPRAIGSSEPGVVVSHIGEASVLVFADLRHSLVVSFIANGMTAFDVDEQRRHRLALSLFRALL